MPKPTFHNLPADKRERFVDAALLEFATHPYDHASITRIVRTLGIAKGSVYQYFDDKFDLFHWLVEQAYARRAAWFATLVMPEHATLFDQLRFAYAQSLRHWFEDPLYNRVALRVLEPSADPAHRELHAELTARTHSHLAQMLSDAQAQGHVRANLNAHRTAWFVQGLLQDGLLRAFLDALDTDLPGFTEHAASFDEGRIAHALAVADDAVTLLEHAIGTA